MLIGPRDWERVGDVSNVVFTNGAIEKDGNVYIYYAASDTRLHVASTTVDKLIDYVFSTPSDPGRSVLCVQQRCDLIRKNLEYINKCKEEGVKKGKIGYGQYDTIKKSDDASCKR